MKRNEIIIIAVVLLAAAVSWLFYRNSSDALGSEAVVSSDGIIYGRYPLDRDISFTVNISDGGYNKVVIKDGAACVSEADCPDKLCVNQGHIHRSGDSIICLPHKLCITIESAQADELDGVVQ